MSLTRTVRKPQYTGGARNWVNVPGSYTFEAFLQAGEWFDGYDGALPAPVCAVLKRCATGDYAEVTISFWSTGYFDPGRTYGPPEKCCPPGGDEERFLSRVTLKDAKGAEVTLDEADGTLIFDALQQEVWDTDLEEDDSGDEP